MSLLKICDRIHAEYKVQHKLRSTVADSGINFVKAFREFETTEEEASDEFDDGIRFLDMDADLEMERDEGGETRRKSAILDSLFQQTKALKSKLSDKFPRALHSKHHYCSH